jgi:hypothetical protein
VVVPQNPAHAGESVLAEPPGQLVLSQLPYAEKQAAGRAQGARMILAQDPATASDGVFNELPGQLKLSRHPQVEGEPADRTNETSMSRRASSEGVDSDTIVPTIPA